MRIGIDARFFGPRAKGLGRYTQKLIEELELIDDQNDYVIFLRRENFDEYQPQSLHFKKVLADYRWYSLGEQLFFPWLIYSQRIDLMHFTHFNLPVFYLKSYIVTIHDLILQHFGTARGHLLGKVRYWFKSLGYKIVIYLAVWRSKKIITVSEYVKNDIIKFFGITPDKVEVVYEGSPPRNPLTYEASESQMTANKEQSTNSEILNKYGIKKPYLLYVGNAYPHKNLPRLIEAFKILREEGQSNLRLVMIGGEDYFYKQLKKENCDDSGICFGGGIIFTGYVPDDKLRGLYADASLYIFPSLCEGFGLPPLEAMAQGVPVVASSATCLPEILGEAAYYFDAESSADMAVKIKEVFENEGLHKKLIAQGFEQIKKYSWKKMAEKTYRLYRT